jgi:glyoxylase-like metal-dependent hydrolase (beta-lactamase superfamily II)
VQQLSFGAITIDAISDGEIACPAAMMFPETDLARFRPFGGVTEDGLLSAILTTFVIRAAGKLVLVDTGMGPDVSPLAAFGFTGASGLLPGGLTAAGIDPERVDTVVFTHLHSDHIGWNTVERAGELRPMFPNARYMVTRTEWEHRVRMAGRRAAAHSLDPVEASGQLTLAGDGDEIAPGVTLFATPGHTPGHTSVLVMDGGEGGIITGDAAHHPLEMEYPEMSPPVDTDPIQSAESRHRLVERAGADGLVVLGGHFPAPTAGTIVRVAGRRTWRWLGA